MVMLQTSGECNLLRATTRMRRVLRLRNAHTDGNIRCEVRDGTSIPIAYTILSVLWQMTFMFGPAILCGFSCERECNCQKSTCRLIRKA